MTSPRLRLLASPVLATLAAGCTLLVSTSGLTTDDSGTSGTGGTSGNVAEGGAATDAPVGKDATSDAFIDEDGSPDSSLGFCAANTGHAFCDDFDEGANVMAKWESHDVEGHGSADSDTTMWRSSPRSFSSSASVGGASAVNIASLSHALGGTTDRVRYSFAFFVTPPNADAGDSFATIRFPQGYLDFLWFKTGELRITERADPMPSLDHDSSSKIAPNRWYRVEVSLTPGHIAAALDGNMVIDATTTRTYSGAATVSLGLYSSDNLAVAFHFDNVVADTVF